MNGSSQVVKAVESKIKLQAAIKKDISKKLYGKQKPQYVSIRNDLIAASLWPIWDALGDVLYIFPALLYGVLECIAAGFERGISTIHDKYQARRLL